MTDVWTRLKAEEKPILLYGTGNGADKILDELQKLCIKVSGVFASSGFVRNRTFRGYKVLSLEDAEKEFGDFVALFSFGSNRDEVIENIKHIMTRHTILAPEVPVCGGEIFNLSFAKKHAEELNKVYSILADEQSKRVFKESVLFKLDGDISHLFACETDENEAFENILKLKSKSSFLDLGAYNGDTVLQFADMVKDFSHVTAVEPDLKSFSKLEKNTQHLNIRRINAAVSDQCGTLSFSSKASRGSSLGGDKTITSVNIDFLAKEHRFDYIKFDVEGAELKAILGGKETIKKDRPKMLISAYHKSDDYFAIPLFVLELNPDYKVYMRHFPYVPAWDTSFYFV